MEVIGTEDRQANGRLFYRVLYVGAAVFIIYHFLYISDFFTYVGIPINPFLHTPMHLGLFLFFIFLLVPAKKGARRKVPPWYDFLLSVLGIFPCIYYALFIAPEFAVLGTISDIRYVIMGWLLILLILEAVRRVLGLIFLGVVVLFIVYPLTASYWPGFLCGLQLSFVDLGSWTYVQPSGIFGDALRVSSTIIVAFLFFGQMLVSSGAAKVFVDGAFSLVGKYRGGPAKVAVASSAFLGMLTGSSVSNVMTTGVLTIPLMKKCGYGKNFAGAVETVASNGGVYMPPIMGSIIFLMVAFTGITYSKIMVVSFIPAFLYFWGLFLAVDFESVKLGLKGLPRSDLPSLKNVIKAGWSYAIPVLTLLYFLIGLQLAPQKAALWSTVVLLLVTAFRKESRVGLKGIMSGSYDTLIGMFMVIGGVSSAGIILTSVLTTGLGTRLATGIIDITGGNLILILLVAAAASYIMGMGMNLIAIYVLLAILVAPAMVMAGIPVMAAHLFVVWWAVIFFITPPIAPCAFAACSISGGDPLKTGLLSMRLAGSVYIVPFAFALGPALLLMGTPVEITIAIASAFIGVTTLACGLNGWMLTKTGWLERILLIAGAVALILPGWTADLVGLGLVVVATLINVRAFLAARARARETV